VTRHTFEMACEIVSDANYNSRSRRNNLNQQVYSHVTSCCHKLFHCSVAISFDDILFHKKEVRLQCRHLSQHGTSRH